MEFKMIRKNSGIKETLRNILIAGTLGLSSFGAISPSYSQETNILKKSEFVEAPLEEKLTQQGDNFYKDSLKEYDVYKKTYINLARDGRIDSKDIKELEKILSKTIKEIDSKLFDNNGNLKKPDLAEALVEYLRDYETMNYDLKLLQKHLSLKEKWLSEDAVKGSFWNYGTGLGFYWNGISNGTVHMQGYKKSGMDALVNYPHGIRRSIYINPTNNNIEVLRLSDEFPAKTKFNYWLGLLGGVIVPQLCGASSLIRRYKSEKKINRENIDLTIMGNFFLNSLPGFIILDSLHPLVYPIRLGLPAVYEASKTMDFWKNKLQKRYGEKSFENEKGPIQKNLEYIEKRPFDK
jgi:hypothetical protein